MSDLDSPQDPRYKYAFPDLSKGEIELLRPFGKEVTVKKDDYVWKAGSRDMCMFVVVHGEMSIIDGRTRNFIAKHLEGSFSGDVDILSGRPTLVHGIAATDLDLLKVPADCVRSIVGEHPELGEKILRAFLVRRALLMEYAKAGPLVIGSRYNADTLRVREFLSRNHIPHQWDDVESNPDTEKLMKEFQVSEDQMPIVVIASCDEKMYRPSNEQLAKALGISRAPDSKIYDLVVVGAGPAGLAAAVYGASEGLSTIVVDSNSPGGQAGTSSRIENYMGFPFGVTGQNLADGAVIQAERFGAQMLLPWTVSDITCGEAGGHSVLIEGKGRIDCKCVILASGATYRKLEVDGMERFEGRGIYYSATHVERILCGDSAVAVVGGGNSAGQAAVFMSESAAHVYLVVRGDDLRKTMSSYLARRIEGSNKITVLTSSEICELHGNGHLEGALIADKKSGGSKEEKISGVFVMIGAVPHTQWLPDRIARDQKGFIHTGPPLVQKGLWGQDRAPFFLETSCPGVFAAGDARCDSVKRVASAVGEGSMAVAFVHQFLAL
jgi:thioredoxin reductase (NADPH)